MSEVSKAVDDKLQQAMEDADPDEVSIVTHYSVIKDRRHITFERRSQVGMITWFHKRWEAGAYMGGGGIGSVRALKAALDWLEP